MGTHMVVCWRSVTRYVILLHRSSILLVAFFSMQNVIKMPTEGFFRRETNMASCVFGSPKWFGRPKTTCHSPEGSGRASLQSRCAWKRKKRNKKWENERCNIQICFQEMGTAENMNAIYPCFQSIVNRIFSSFGIVSRDLFSATVRPVHDVRCIFEELLIMNFISANSSF